jgi:hypothetical protein
LPAGSFGLGIPLGFHFATIEALGRELANTASGRPQRT